MATTRWNARTRHDAQADPLSSPRDRRIFIVKDFLGTFFSNISLFEAALQDVSPLFDEEDIDVVAPMERILESVLSNDTLALRAKEAVHDHFAYLLIDSELTFRDVLHMWFDCYFYGVHKAEGGEFPAFYQSVRQRW